MSNTSYLNFPISIIEGIFENHNETFNNIVKWAAADVMKGCNGQFPTARLLAANQELQINMPVNQSTYQQCLDIYKKYTGARTGLSRENAKYLKQCWGFLKDSDKVLWLAFIAAKSIIGNKAYCKTNDLMLFARMNGLLRAYANEKDLKKHSNPLISNFYTRRKRDTLRKRLAEEFHIKCYSFHDRGYFISRRLSLERLVELVELDRHQKKSYQGKTARARKRALELIHENLLEDSS